MSKIKKIFDKNEQTNKARFLNLYKFISTFSYDYGIDSLTLLCATLLELLLLWLVTLAHHIMICHSIADIQNHATIVHILVILKLIYSVIVLYKLATILNSK